jgi:diacylglycerol kinase (ATP)
VSKLTCPEAVAMSDQTRLRELAAVDEVESLAPDSAALPVSERDEGAPDLNEPSDLNAQADRRNARGKLAAGWRGLKAAIRGDSSFFAHGYRGTLIALTAALLRVDQRGWCLLVLGACLVLIAELAHSAVDTLARAVGDPEEPRLKTAREIAAASVLVAAVGSGAVTVIVLSWKFVELLSAGA